MSNLLESSPWDESRLVSLLKQGREDAYRVLIQKYQKLVFRIAYGITFDQEESLDITQEVFLKVYQNIHRFEQKSKLSTWLHRITVNEGLNWKRRWKRRLRWRHRRVRDRIGTRYGTAHQHLRAQRRSRFRARSWGEAEFVRGKRASFPSV